MIGRPTAAPQEKGRQRYQNVSLPLQRRFLSGFMALFAFFAMQTGQIAA